MSRYYIDFSLKNGLGSPSASLYLTGCDKPVKCKGCHNYELQGIRGTEFNINKIYRELKEEVRKGQELFNLRYVSYLGGEPLAPYNREITKIISKKIKKEFRVKNILYTWRTLEKIKEENLDEYIEYMDYGILGEYRDELRDTDRIPSSKNQYIYNFNTNKKEKDIILK
jgi:anaerobic ribonucleoside-triphosphate reductase activating protein